MPLKQGGQFRVKRGGQLGVKYSLGFKIQNNHPENKVTLDLPLNYTDLDILKLRNQTSEKQLEIVNAKRLIEQAEKRLEINIELAYKTLKDYGVNKNEIIQLINKSLI